MQGWTKLYEFSLADLRSGADTVCRSVAHAKAKPGAGIAWPYLKGLLLNAVYGGRVDDAYDAKVGQNCNPVLWKSLSKRR